MFIFSFLKHRLLENSSFTFFFVVENKVEEYVSVTFLYNFFLTLYCIKLFLNDNKLQFIYFILSLNNSKKTDFEL